MKFKSKLTRCFFRVIEVVGLIIIGARFVYRYIFTEGFPDNPSVESLEKYYRQEIIRGWIELAGYILFGAE